MKLKPCPFCGGEMREKLIELLNDHVCLECKDECAEECSSCLADHLLANGVIVLPCKAGQKVYTIQRSAIMEWTVSGIWISADL